VKIVNCLVYKLFHERDKFGRTALHISASNGSFDVLNTMLEVLGEIDREYNNDHVDKILSLKDEESGYTALHRAALSCDLRMLLILLSHGMEGKVHPMKLLEDKCNVFVNSLDNDGKKAADLLGEIVSSDLKKCRNEMTFFDGKKSKKSKCRSTSFNELIMTSSDDDVDDVDDVDDSINVEKEDREYECEVLTFGDADKCALGVIGKSCRPRRVKHFSVSGDESAVHIAALTYHTLVVTKNRDLYAFGLGKSGRLGTGDEQHKAIPTRVSLSGRKVFQVAAATNHSLCCTFDGDVFAWGSNRFKQLGVELKQQREIVCSPRRVERLRRRFVIQVGAGDRHSVALSHCGEVYSWGDNRAGQLGKCSQSPDRVESLKHLKGIAISASELSSLVLCHDKEKFSEVQNSVYTFGHGNVKPVKICFGKVNPVRIACAKYHNAIITSEGEVYTWGLHSDPLGTKKCETNITAPQLVTGMLSINGGGHAVAVAASESHTAVLCDKGNLYTWGAANFDKILGHEGRRYQPLPRRVPGVYRAVQLALAKEHTVLLVATYKPSIPLFDKESTLQLLCERQLALKVDIFNVLWALQVAQRLYSQYLIEFCKSFLRRNIDAVLAYSKKEDLYLFLQEETQVENHFLQDYLDGYFYHFTSHLSLKQIFM